MDNVRGLLPCSTTLFGMAEFDPTRPFLASTAREHLTAWALRPPRFRQVFRGVWVAAGCRLSLSEQARAALMVTPTGSHLSHHTAARLLGGVVPDDPDIHVSSQQWRSKKRGIASHVASEHSGRQEFRGLPVTTALQTFTDLGPHLSLVDLVVLGDSLAKAGRFTPDELVRWVTGRRGRYSARLRRAASYVRTGVDSPMESRMRMLIVLAGLPEPVIDHRVFNRFGDLIARFDTCYVEYRLIVEYDGRDHAKKGQWGKDITRREWLDHTRWRLVVVRAEDLYSTPARTVQRIIDAMRDVGMPVPVLSAEWRRHFPSRPGDLDGPR